MLWGGELILRDGAVAGQVTSAAWGDTTGACVGLAYIRAGDDAVVTPDWVRAGSYSVNVGGEVYPITVSLKAIYDPATSGSAADPLPNVDFVHALPPDRVP